MNANMTPVDWAKRPVQKYMDFSGRAPRAEYWWYTLAVIISVIVVSIVEGIVGLDNMVGPYGPLSMILMLGLLVPGIAVSVRRLHDTDRTGWWLLLPLVPYCIGLILAGPAMLSGSMEGLGAAGILMVVGAIGGIVLLIFYVLPGTKGDNRYGPDPYAGQA
jgi:uncharacterized membrane protein YhaH (DUF805 family)